MKNPATIIISVILLLLVVVFTIQNSDKIIVKLFFWDADISLSLILFSTMFIGVLIGIFSLVPTILRQRRIIKKLK